MLSAIGFHRQSMLDTGEIEDERPDSMLAAELVALQLSPAQGRP
jgi:hypothetical protein